MALSTPAVSNKPVCIGIRFGLHGYLGSKLLPGAMRPFSIVGQEAVAPLALVAFLVTMATTNRARGLPPKPLRAAYCHLISTASTEPLFELLPVTNEPPP